jgi:hypothetical protein
MNDFDSDEKFLGYVYLHSQTELALFSKVHINRLLKFAGKKNYKNLAHLSWCSL